MAKQLSVAENNLQHSYTAYIKQTLSSILQVRQLAKRLSVAENDLQHAVLDDFKLLLGGADVKVCVCVCVCAVRM